MDDPNAHGPSMGRPIPSAAELQKRLAAFLKDEFCLDPLPAFCLLVEGWTDVGYLLKAAELARDLTGEDLLTVPPHFAQDGMARIAIRTPGLPKEPQRGGIPQMVRLANRLQSYVFTLEVFAGIIFLFDHDEAGRKAQQEIGPLGFKPDVNSLTLNPKCHPCACVKKGNMVMEDLLSLEIQRRFFDLGNAWCNAEYENGNLVRLSWGYHSKGSLSEFVCKLGTWKDLREVGRVLHRVRTVFGLPTNAAIFDATTA